MSDELGEAGPGCDRSLCGYQIRFESRRCATTRLTYATTGVLLRRLQQDPTIADVSCVIVDEVGMIVVVLGCTSALNFSIHLVLLASYQRLCC